MSEHRFVIITGMSGAGKTTVVRVLEDLGFFCIDNLPPSLIPKLADLVEQSASVGDVALVVDARGGQFFDSAAAALDELKARGYDYHIFFLDADDATLIRRYKETRRRHPLSQRPLEGIERERHRMTDIKERADYVVDTTHLSPLALRDRITDLLSTDGIQRLQVNLVSFGYKFGLPPDADIVLDVRYLPNPYYVQELSHLDGCDPQVSAFVFRSELTHQFLARAWGLLEFLLPHYLNEGRTHLTVAVGCTGGRHRSVAIIARLAELFSTTPHSVRVGHRDLGREAVQPEA